MMDTQLNQSLIYDYPATITKIKQKKIHLNQTSSGYVWRLSNAGSWIITVATQMGKVVLHWKQFTSITGKLALQIGHGCDSSGCASSISLTPRGVFRTIASIFLLYFVSIWLRYSGRINITANVNADFCRPARWHSMTVDVKIGTTSNKCITIISVNFFFCLLVNMVFEMNAHALEIVIC